MTRGSGRRVVAHDAHVQGFDLIVVEAWLAANTSAVRPFEWERLSGGHSNLTYLVRDAHHEEFVVRRPPLGTLLPKAHDMWREYRIVAALWATEVPVAEPVAFCDDRTIADAHFYVMRRVDGRALYTATDAAGWLPEATRRRAGLAFVEALAALHSVVPASVGLADLGRPDGYMDRQLKTWYSSWTAQAVTAGLDDSRIHELHSMLSSRVPEQTPARIVHGDYGPHNAMFDGSGEVRAVLDWELATLGEPLADLAYTLNAWAEPDEPGIFADDPPTALPGFPSRLDLANRYAELTGTGLQNLPFYRTFNAWKVACIQQGVYARYRSGQKSSDGVDMDAVRNGIENSIAVAVEQAQRL